jgi:hypothetical protein
MAAIDFAPYDVDGLRGVKRQPHLFLFDVFDADCHQSVAGVQCDHFALPAAENQISFAG